jgi:hypothetical protein
LYGHLYRRWSRCLLCESGGRGPVRAPPQAARQLNTPFPGCMHNSGSPRRLAFALCSRPYRAGLSEAFLTIPVPNSSTCGASSITACAGLSCCRNAVPTGTCSSSEAGLAVPVSNSSTCGASSITACAGLSCCRNAVPTGTCSIPTFRGGGVLVSAWAHVCAQSTCPHSTNERQSRVSR